MLYNYRINEKNQVFLFADRQNSYRGGYRNRGGGAYAKYRYRSKIREKRHLTYGSLRRTFGAYRPFAYRSDSHRFLRTLLY